MGAMYYLNLETYSNGDSGKDDIRFSFVRY